MVDVVSSGEAAQLLGCSPDNVRRLVRVGRLRAVIETRAGRLYAIRDVQDLAAARRRTGRRPPTNG